MTVTSTNALAGPHVANGANRLWPFNFKLLSVSHMRLQITDADGSNLQVISTGFTIDPSYIGDDAGGYVTYPVLPALPLVAGKVVRPLRSVDYTQPNKIGNQQGFFPKTHEDTFDLLEMQIQQNRRDIDRSMKVPFGSDGIQIDILPEGHFWLSDANGNMVDGGLGSDISHAQEYSAIAAAAAANVVAAFPSIASGPLELIAHRGFKNLFPENTMAAFTYAAASGASCEFDVQISNDGVPIIIHDATVDRTTDGTGNVADIDLADLKLLDAADTWAAHIRPQRIPTFEEALKFFQGVQTAIYPEIKGYRTQADIELMIDLVVEYGMESRVNFQSFYLSDLQYARAYNLTIGLALVADNISALTQLSALGGRLCYTLNYTPVLANPSWVASCRAAGVDVAVWTVNDPSLFRSLMDIGVTRIMSDFAGRVA